MAEAVKLYHEIGFPALQKGGQDKKLVGYFQSDTGAINQLVHLWNFDDDTAPALSRALSLGTGMRRHTRSARLWCTSKSIGKIALPPQG